MFRKQLFGNCLLKCGWELKRQIGPSFHIEKMVVVGNNSIKNNILRQEKGKDSITPAWLRQKWSSHPMTFLGSSASTGGT